MYPAKLSLETKCPNCSAPITSIGGTLYTCHAGHVIECVVIVTLNKNQVRPKPENTEKPQLKPPMVI